MHPVPGWLSFDQSDYVEEAGRALDCGTQRSATTVQVLASADEVRSWQISRGVTLAGDDVLRTGAYALVELGSRPSGGYGLLISRDADVRNDTLILHATSIEPDANHPATDGITSPCVLLSLPAKPYRGVSVVNQYGRLLATTLPGE